VAATRRLTGAEHDRLIRPSFVGLGIPSRKARAITAHNIRFMSSEEIGGVIVFAPWRRPPFMAETATARSIASGWVLLKPLTS